MKLTKRQRDVVELVAEGLTYREVGKRLRISSETVRAHVNLVANKNGVTERPLRWIIANAARLLAA